MLAPGRGQPGDQTAGGGLGVRPGQRAARRRPPPQGPGARGQGHGRLEGVERRWAGN